MGLFHCFIYKGCASKKIGDLIHSIKFLSHELTLYVNKSTIQIYKEYCCHVCAGAPGCYLNMLDNLQKQVVGLLVQHWLSLLDPWFIIEMWPAQVFWYSYYFGRCSSELLNWNNIA